MKTRTCNFRSRKLLYRKLFYFLLTAVFPILLIARPVYAADISAEQQEVKTLSSQIKLELKKLQEIESKIHHINEAQKAKVKNLISIYSSMTPKNAAGLLPRINKDIAVYILSHMTARKASAIISEMPVKDAVFFTDSIAGK